MREDVAAAVASSKTYADALRKLGKTTNGGHYRRLRQLVHDYGLDTSHMLGRRHRLGRPSTNAQRPLSEILTYGSKYKGAKLKRRLLAEGIWEPRCSECGESEWGGIAIPLQVHHKNEDPLDNRLDNLCLLCPNCHAVAHIKARGGIKTRRERRRKAYRDLPLRYKCPDCGKPKKQKNRCTPCALVRRRKVKDRPTKDVLRADIAELGYVGAGKKYGVSDNAIRKWLRAG